MITISPAEYSSLPAVTLTTSGDSDLATTTRRTSRIATLDGGAVISDFGFSQADRTLRIVSNSATRADYAALLALQSAYALLLCSCEEGVFLGSLARLQSTGQKVSADFYVKEKLSG